MDLRNCLLLLMLFLIACEEEQMPLSDSTNSQRLEYPECKTEGDFVWYIVGHGQSNINTPQISDEYTGVHIFRNGAFENAEIKMITSWLGLQLFEAYGKEVYMVNVGKGGSAVNQNIELDWNVDSEHELLDSLKNLHTVAIEELESKGVHINKIHLWIQGGGDFISAEAVEAYKENEFNMLDNLRNHFGEAYPLYNYHLNRFVNGETNNLGVAVGDVINQAKQENVERLGNAWIVNPTDPEIETSDGIHWTNEVGKPEAARRIFNLLEK